MFARTHLDGGRGNSTFLCCALEVDLNNHFIDINALLAFLICSLKASKLTVNFNFIHFSQASVALLHLWKDVISGPRIWFPSYNVAFLFWCMFVKNILSCFIVMLHNWFTFIDHILNINPYFSFIIEQRFLLLTTFAEDLGLLI